METTWFSSPRVSSKYLFFEILSRRSCICVESLRCGSSYASWEKVPLYYPYKSSLSTFFPHRQVILRTRVVEHYYIYNKPMSIRKQKVGSSLIRKIFREISEVRTLAGLQRWRNSGRAQSWTMRKREARVNLFPWDENDKNAEFNFSSRKQSKPNKLKRSCSTFSNKLTKNCQFLCRQASLT